MRIYLQYTTGLGDAALSVTVDGDAAGYLAEGEVSSDGNSWYWADIAIVGSAGPYPVAISYLGEVVGNDLAWPDTASTVYPVTNLTGQGIINDVLSILRNNSTSVRTKLLRWLNIVSMKLTVARPGGWQFLQYGEATITPASDAITTPSDYGGLRFFTAGTYMIDTRRRLTDWEAAAGHSGYTEVPGSIRLHNLAFTGDVTLYYTVKPGQIADSTDATAWPPECQPIFFRALLDFFYEYDMDERQAMGYQLSAAELSELKKWDNRAKARTQRSRHGYRGTR